MTRVTMTSSPQAARQDDYHREWVQYFGIQFPVQNGVVEGVPRWLVPDLLARGMTVYGDQPAPPIGSMREELEKATDDADLRAFINAHGDTGSRHIPHVHSGSAPLREAGFYEQADLLDDYYRKHTKGEQGTIVIIEGAELRARALELYDEKVAKHEPPRTDTGTNP